MHFYTTQLYFLATTNVIVNTSTVSSQYHICIPWSIYIPKSLWKSPYAYRGGATVLPFPLLGHFVKDFMKTVDILNICPPPAKFLESLISLSNLPKSITRVPKVYKWYSQN